VARRWWELSKDPDDYVGNGRWGRTAEEREEEAARAKAEAEARGPEPELHPRAHWGLIAATVAVWIGAMTLLHVHWWDFDRHGPWLTPLTPFLLAGALEGLLIRFRPEWNRHHDPDAPAKARRGAEALGERARPYWAREGYVADRLEEGPEPPGPTPDPEPAPDLSARTRRSP
jgi:hypothetical protein